jgi:hypothetical protein
MKLHPARRGAPQPLEYLDGLMDCYLTWRKESRSAAESYRHWTLAPWADRSGAFSRYAAALDREEEAAACYRSAVEALAAPGPVRSDPSRRAVVPSLDMS